MKKNKYILVFLVFLCTNGMAQPPVKAWVFFTHKDTTGFCMSTYFDASVIERRQQQGLPAWDLYDVPVTPEYEKTITAYSDSVLVVSRWLNGMAVWISPAKLNTVRKLGFVANVYEVNNELEGGICEVDGIYGTPELSESLRRLMHAQTKHMRGDAFKKAGFTGKGVRVAVIDAGFKGLSVSQTIRHLRLKGKILHTWDYIKRSSSVEHGTHHGTAVLSCIAGQLDSVRLGHATQAEFLLYRTEKTLNEKLNEEEYWLAAAEDAEKRGAQIINTSLGYTGRRYFRNDMDGKQSILARAANMAARKGILVVCSAGNEGASYWRIISTPADADSVLSVGALNPWTGIQADWSSVGPSYDKRVKPNVCAYGFVVADDGQGYVAEVPGTSFSSPLTAGFAACIVQMHPQYNVMQLITEIEKSAHLYPYFDYAHGYGTPQATYFTDSIHPTVAPTFTILSDGDSVRIKINDNCLKPAYLSNPNPPYHWGNMEINERPSYHINEENYTSASSFLHETDPGYFYYGLLNSNRYLDWYYVLNVRMPNVLSISKSSIEGMGTLIFHYRGYTQQWPQR